MLSSKPGLVHDTITTPPTLKIRNEADSAFSAVLGGGILGVAAVLRGLVDSFPLSFVHSDNGHSNRALFNAVNEAIARTTELDLIMTQHAVQAVTGNMRLN